MSTSDPQPASPEELEILSKAAASPTVTRKRTKKTTAKKAVAKKVTAKVEAKPETAVVVEESQGDGLKSSLDALLDRAATLPVILDKATVSLHLEVDDAATPVEAVAMVLQKFLEEGLTSWTYVVRDEVTGTQWLVDNGVVSGSVDG